VAIELIGQQVQLYLQVAQQIDQLRQVAQQISAAQERERTLLAAELHDTIQQFLGRLPFFLVASKEAIVDNPEEAAELLERSLLDIQEAAVTVQQIRQTLAPIHLNHSLTRSLKALVAHAERRHGMEILLALEGDLDVATTLETRHALYRVIQHALDNAALHAEADTVTVEMRLVNGQVHFQVADHGRGATSQMLTLAQTTGHFGLQSMRARIEACGGEFAFETAAGKGMRVWGWVPVPA
jgi:signal transduction histidine kinase